MRHRHLLASALLVLAATFAASGAQAQKPKPKPKPYEIPGPVSIAATPNPSVFSTPVTISGRVESAGGGVTVTLQGRAVPSTTYATLATARTENNGKYRFVQRPGGNTYYRVIAATSPQKQSGELRVNVAMLVGLRVSDATPARGARVRFSGIVRPRHNGRLAYIQKQSASGRFVTVARVRLRALDSRSSRYSKTLRVRRSGNYRVRVLGHSDHAMGISRTRTIVVH